MATQEIASGDVFAPPTAASVARLLAIAAIVLVAASVGVHILCFDRVSYNSDPYAFALVGRDILEGRLPYSGIFDNKPIGLYYLFSLSELIFGQTALAVRAVAVASMLSAAAIVWRSSTRLAGEAGPEFSLVAAALFCLLSLTNSGVAAMSELVACPALALANYLVILRRTDHISAARFSLLLGAVFGLGAQISYLIAPIAVLVTLADLMLDALDGSGVGEIVRRGALVAIGFLAVFVLILLPQIVSGDIVGYFATQLRYSLSYRVPTSVHVYWRGMFGPVMRIAPALLIAAALLPIGAHFVGWPERRRWRPAVIFSAGFVGALIAAMASQRFYPHYFILALPFLIMLTMTFLALLPSRLRLVGLLGVLAFGGAVGGGYMWQVGANLVANGFAQPSFEAEVADHIRLVTTPDERIFVFYESHAIYYLARRDAVTHIVFPGHYSSERVGVTTFIDPHALLEQALAQRPALIVIGGLGAAAAAASARSRIQQAGYKWRARFIGSDHVAEIYER